MRNFRQDQHLYLRHNPRVKNLSYEVWECTRKSSRAEFVGLKLAEHLDVLHARLMDQHTCECKRFQDVLEESRCTAKAEKVKRGIVVDPDARALVPNSSSTDVKP